MKKIIREVAQLQIIHDVSDDKYFNRNKITEQVSYWVDKVKADALVILNRFEFASRCIKRAGNNLQSKFNSG
jgi:hypothetical protein